MNIEEFVKIISVAVAQQVSQAPPKSFNVVRTAINGAQSTQVNTLPQIMAELTDTMRVDMELRKQQMFQNQQLLEKIAEQCVEIEELTVELKENNELAKRHLRKMKDA